jgi:hypothetical protein
MLNLPMYYRYKFGSWLGEGGGSVTKREGRELERELCRNTETTRHGERTDPNRI